MSLHRVVALNRSRGTQWQRLPRFYDCKLKVSLIALRSHWRVKKIIGFFG